MISKLFLIFTLIGAIVATTTINSTHGSVSTFPKHSSQKNMGHEPFKITDELKKTIRSLVDNNKTNAAIAIGLVDPNGTQFYGYGNMSNANPTTVDKDTIFAIGSITKVFTTILLADMVDRGLVNLDDPIEKYLPSTVKGDLDEISRDINTGTIALA